MTIDKKNIAKIIADRAIPEHIKSQYPVFSDFVGSFYEWLELDDKSPHTVVSNLLDYRDVDKTLDEFIEHFRKEYLVNIPTDIQADKRLLAKQIKNFYLNKGNEQSYKFLFRLLYNEDIEFYYPKVDVLRASDGKWYEQKTIRIVLDDPKDIKYLKDRLVVGQTSSASAVIEDAVSFIEREINLVEISLSNLSGVFAEGETVEIQVIDPETGNTIKTISSQLIEMFTSVNITNGGSSYLVGDIINIKDDSGNIIGTAKVIKVTKGPIVSLNLIDGGSGYRANVNETITWLPLPVNWTLDGDYLLNTPLTDYTTIALDSTFSTQNVPGEGDVIEILDVSTSNGSGAYGIVDLVDPDGSILSVKLINFGDNYQTPSANVISTTGSGAIIDVIGGGGEVDRISMQRFGIYRADRDNDSGNILAYPDFTDKGDGNATGTLNISSVAHYIGRYLNDDGHLSSTKKLQDNFYYQDYSYVIKSALEPDLWRETIKKILHPAGLALFGEIIVKTDINTNVDTINSRIKLYTFNGDPYDEGAPILDGSGNWLVDY